MIDEFDVIEDKSGFGYLVKSFTSDTVKFAISGISSDISTLIDDHGSVARLIEQGYAHVRPMSQDETADIFKTAEDLFEKRVSFADDVIRRVFSISEGYPYFAQLIGKYCVEMGNSFGSNDIDNTIFDSVLEKIRLGEAFPSLEAAYRKAIGDSEGRSLILTLLAEEESSISDVGAGITLKDIRTTAKELDVEYIDQLVPRLIDRKFGPALIKREDLRGTYEFVDPVFRAYVKLRR